MKHELESRGARACRGVNAPGSIGTKWMDSKSEVPVSIRVVNEFIAPAPDRERAWWRLLGFALPTFGNMIMWVGLAGLFLVYWLNSLGRTVKLRENKRIGWQRIRYLPCHILLALLFGLGESNL